MIYLDTHVVVWLYAGQVEKLSHKVKELLNSNEIVISPIVRLELQYLYEIQRITEEPKKILNDLSDRIGIKICEKNFNSIINYSMSYSWTRDPFDRIIVANASVGNNILISKDQNILKNYDKAVW